MSVGIISGAYCTKHGYAVIERRSNYGNRTVIGNWKFLCSFSLSFIFCERVGKSFFGGGSVVHSYLVRVSRGIRSARRRIENEALFELSLAAFAPNSQWTAWEQPASCRAFCRKVRTRRAFEVSEWVHTLGHCHNNNNTMALSTYTKAGWTYWTPRRCIRNTQNNSSKQTSISAMQSIFCSFRINIRIFSDKRNGLCISIVCSSASRCIRQTWHNQGQPVPRPASSCCPLSTADTVYTALQRISNRR